MIHALRYEPRSQRQRFEPREQQRGEGQDRHIHLHLHLNFTFRARQERWTHPNAVRIPRIFSALFAATVVPLGAFIYTLLTHDGPPDPLLSLGNLALLILFVGLALAWGFGYLPLLVSAWRTSQRERFSLFGPLLLGLGSSLLFLLGFRSALHPLFGSLLFLLTFVHPLITALLFRWVSREARDLREIAPAYRRLSFVLMSGMGITLLGGLLWNLFAMLGSLPFVWLIVPLLPATGAAVLVAIFTLFTSRKRTQPRPKDASPSDVDSEHMPRGYRD